MHRQQNNEKSESSWEPINPFKFQHPFSPRLREKRKLSGTNHMFGSLFKKVKKTTNNATVLSSVQKQVSNTGLL